MADEATVTDRVVLSTKDIVLAGVGETRNVLDGISLEIHAGEVLGIAGVEGNGQAELVEVIMGIREPTSGTVHLDGVDISDRGTREIREAGVAYIPEDRHRHGLLLEAPLWENRILGHQTETPNARGVLVSEANLNLSNSGNLYAVYATGKLSLVGIPGVSLTGIGGGQATATVKFNNLQDNWVFPQTPRLTDTPLPINTTVMRLARNTR